MAMQDYYEGQRWKQHPGIANVVLWCVNALEVFSRHLHERNSATTFLPSPKLLSTCGTLLYLQL